jgi:hypothetical protein
MSFCRWAVLGWAYEPRSSHKDQIAKGKGGEEAEGNKKLKQAEWQRPLLPQRRDYEHVALKPDPYDNNPGDGR